MYEEKKERYEAPEIQEVSLGNEDIVAAGNSAPTAELSPVGSDNTPAL